MAGSFLETDIATMVNTDELGDTAVWTDAATSTASDNIDGQFIDSFEDINPITGEVINTDPLFICAASSVTGVLQGDNLTVKSKSHNIVKAVKDESGVVMEMTLNKVVT